MARTDRRRAAFTLVEVLMSALILSIVLGVAMGLMYYYSSSHRVVSQAEAMVSYHRFFDRLEDDLANAILRTAADVQVGNEGEVVRFRRRVAATKDSPAQEIDVVYLLADPQFKNGPSPILRNGRPIGGVSANELSMELDPAGGQLVVHTILVDSRSKMSYLCDSRLTLTALQEALVYGPFQSPPPAATPTPAVSP